MEQKEYLCPACEWTGKGEALVECPVCRQELTELTAVLEAPGENRHPQKYNPEELEKVEDIDV